MTDLTELLKEYDNWKTRKAFSIGVPDSPAVFMQEKRIERIVSALADILDVDAGLIDSCFEEEDIVWLKSQGTTEVAVDGEV